MGKYYCGHLDCIRCKGVACSLRYVSGNPSPSLTRVWGDANGRVFRNGTALTVGLI